jgi:hypothetical protein
MAATGKSGKGRDDRALLTELLREVDGAVQPHLCDPAPFASRALTLGRSSVCKFRGGTRHYLVDGGPVTCRAPVGPPVGWGVALTATSRAGGVGEINGPGRCSRQPEADRESLGPPRRYGQRP